MLSDDQVNEIIIEVENVPSGVQSHPSSNQIVPEKTLVNSSFSMVSSISDIGVTDSQSFSDWNDKKGRRLLWFPTSLNDSISQILHSPESLGTDIPCTSHENMQGSRPWGKEGGAGAKKASSWSTGFYSFKTSERLKVW